MRSQQHRLFTSEISEERLHEGFIALRDSPGYVSARRMVEEVFDTFTDLDGNFVEQFQTSGFNPRLWELYLHAYFEESMFRRSLTHDSPDFGIEKGDGKIWVEATTVNPTQGSQSPSVDSAESESKTAIHEQQLEGRYAIKFGSPLFSKLQKEYWMLPHVAQTPLVFAIADFQETGSMTFTGSALERYLYGVTHDWEHDSAGKLVVLPRKLHAHVYEKKEIPAGFFVQPKVENVGAVLFSASATISKFARMGYQQGYSPPGVQIRRRGFRYSNDPNAVKPTPIDYVLGTTDHVESWGEGLSMFHNHCALHPIDQWLFPDIAHHRFEGGQVVSQLPAFHPYGSYTIITLK